MTRTLNHTFRSSSGDPLNQLLFAPIHLLPRQPILSWSLLPLTQNCRQTEQPDSLSSLHVWVEVVAHPLTFRLSHHLPIFLPTNLSACLPESLPACLPHCGLKFPVHYHIHRLIMPCVRGASVHVLLRLACILAAVRNGLPPRLNMSVGKGAAFDAHLDALCHEI